MFEYEKENYEVNSEEDKSYYELMFCKVYGVYSPFDVNCDVEFPKKGQLGGTVLKFIGGGAAYFKIQRKMPSKEEVNDIFEVCKFLQKSFGDYVVAIIHCEPHIEIRDIEVPGSENISIHFVSSRKNNGERVVDDLIKKLENDEKFTVDDYLQKWMLPFMSRKDEREFQSKYLRLSKLFKEKNLKSPSVDQLSRSNMSINRIF